MSNDVGGETTGGTARSLFLANDDVLPGDPQQHAEETREAFHLGDELLVSPVVTQPTQPSLPSDDQEDYKLHNDNDDDRLGPCESLATTPAMLGSLESNAASLRVATRTTNPLEYGEADSMSEAREANRTTGRGSSKRKQPPRSDTFERTRFKDVIGHGAAKMRIEEMLLPMALPPSVASSVLIGIRALPASIILYGPPGCGKVRQRCVSPLVVAFGC
jgi:SpoVK/Ycf46/Vps4 family AAA+-type ATPase